jgi:heat shock protein HtpX
VEDPNERLSVESMLGLGALGARINESRLWVTLGLLSLAIAVAGYRIGDRYGLVIGFFIALSLDALIFFYDEWRLLNQFPSEEIEGADAWGLNRLTKDLAKRLAHPMPCLREVESETPFLFAAGLFQSRLKIFVSSALARKLSNEELSAVIACELERSKLGLTRTTTATVAAADLF